jgi:hypothetical protein
MKELGMQLPKGKSRSAVLWVTIISLGLLVSLIFSKYLGPSVPLEDTYKNILQKSEILSQMRINLLKSVEMEKNAVMAVTDEESQKFADQSRAASAAVEQDLHLLRSLLNEVPLPDEQKLVMEFDNGWAEFLKLDQVILELAVQNTNLKAASLSRDKGGEAIRKFELALDGILRPYLGTPNEDRIARLLCHSLTAALKIYNLHSSHIAETSDQNMDQIEMLMKKEESEAAKPLTEVAGIVDKGSRDALLPAKTAFAEFMEVTVTVIKLSRQNSNIKSLELSLGRKRKVAAQCDEILAAFQETVQSRTFKATR